MSQLYVLVERLKLPILKATAITADMAKAVPTKSIYPCKNLHTRTSIDGLATIYEADFDTDAIKPEAFALRLAGLLEVKPDEVKMKSEATKLGLTVMLATALGDMIRVTLFGYAGDWPKWEVSGDACRAYLSANAKAWEPPEEVTNELSRI